MVRNKACLPRSFPLSASAREGSSVTAVMIGVDPHKGSHTAVAVGSDERQLGRCGSARRPGRLSS